MASLLVIGGSGFFGKSILDSYKKGLLKKWKIDTIIIMSRNASELKKTNPTLINHTIDLVNTDISCCNSLPFSDYVIHAAASADAKKYLENPKYEKMRIEEGVRNYCQLAKTHHKNSKIIFVSSGAVYGLQPSHVKLVPETYSTEGEITGLSINKRDYALAKRKSEHEFAELGRLGLSVSIARCFTFVGIYLPLDRHFAIGNFINDGINNRAIKIETKNKVIRSYMEADDLVEWLMCINENSNEQCPVYNVGSDEEISIHELAKKIAIIYGVQVNGNENNMNASIDRYVPDIKKAKNELGLAITRRLDEAINNIKNTNRDI